MHQPDIPHLEVCQCGLRQFFHLTQGHGFVRLVVEIKGAASTGVVADNPFKNDGSPVLRPLEGISDLQDGNFRPHDGATLRLKPGGRSCGWSNRPPSSAHRREQADLVAFMKDGRASRILLIDGAGYRPRQRLETRKYPRVMRYDASKIGARLHLQALLLPPNNVLKLPEKQHLNTHGVSSISIPNSGLDVLWDFGKNRLSTVKFCPIFLKRQNIALQSAHLDTPVENIGVMSGEQLFAAA